MIDLFLLGMIIFIFAVLVFVNFYLLAIYCHRIFIYILADDKDGGTALFCKIMVVLGLTLAWT